MKLNNILFLVLNCFTSSTASEPPVLANHLFNLGQYDEAITEYKRYIFHHENSGIGDSVCLQLALSCRYLGDLDQSDKYLDLSQCHSQTQGFNTRIDIEKAINQLIAGNYDSAKTSLQLIIESANDLQIKKQAWFYISLADVLDADYGSAWYGYSQYLHLDSTDNNGQIQSRTIALLDSASHVIRKSPGKAILLSKLLPGLGQAYCGSYLQGLNAFLVNGSMAGLIVFSVVSSNYVSALVYAYFLGLFYTGNLLRTKMICNEYNKRLDQNLRKVILLNLMNELHDHSGPDRPDN